jgi:hypothetical protein
MVSTMTAFRWSYCAALLTACAFAQAPVANYDEAKVPAYKLPDPLVMRDGEPVRDAATWQQKRRPEIVQLFETQMFGRTPARQPKMTFELASIDQAALGGKAIRKEVSIGIEGKAMRLLLYIPADARGPVPVFLGLNFQGNHAINADPGITLGDTWVVDPQTKVRVKQRAAEKTRGATANRWPVEKILAKGFALATIHYYDIEPDFDGGLPHSMRTLFYQRGQTAPAADEWAAISAWAWGLSRAVDYLETDKAIDAKRIALMGHSRLGKAALWAGAMDQRFALVVSNDSGEGGAAISRRQYGETVADLNARFPHWFCANYRQYSGKEDTLPFDSHMLIALIAPRPVYVASALEDQWADPRGEFQGAVAAGPVYQLFGKKGIGTDRMPEVHQPVGGTVRYHIRAGKHDVTDYDWEQYLAFAAENFKPRR